MNFSPQAIYNWYRSTIRNPKYRWWIILGSLTYLFSPIDIAPDFLPIIGWIDDGIVLTLLMSEVSQMMAERLKIRKQNDAEAFNSNPTTETGTVDVDAVSMK